MAQRLQPFVKYRNRTPELNMDVTHPKENFPGILALNYFREE